MLWLGIVSNFGATPSAPLSPEAERLSFQFADASLAAELVACEPQVMSPVAIAWDGAGRLWVAEMRDYPNATNGGTIRLLSDLDRDGRYETSKVFAEGIRFPNSVLPWNGGVLVTAAPDLLFLKDHDGDGRADERRVLFTGFGTGNQQLRANGLVWGPDGWVYGANGRSDGSVRRPSETNTYSLRGRDFRFRPGSGEFETLAGRSQFGVALDEFGNRFLSWNTIPVRQEIFPDRYLARNELLPAVDVVADLLPREDSGEVYPLTPPPLVFNNESSSHFNALAGLAIFKGDALGREYRGNVFVGESLRNLVHRRMLRPAGVSFIAERPETGTEFLRSSDPWFHPVNFATGPDGALYIVDFYRQFVEHPDFVPGEMRSEMPWLAGSEYGRIWRVVRKNRRPNHAPEALGFAAAPTHELLGRLRNSTTWIRETAFHQLLERKDFGAAKGLRTLARKARIPQTRILALHGLDALAKLDAGTALRALGDAHPRVREHALRLAEPVLAAFAPAADIAAAARSLVIDSDARVRLQAVLSLGAIRNGELREPELARVLQNETNEWLRLAALSGSRVLTKASIAALLPRRSRPLRPPPQPQAAAPDRQRVVEEFKSALTLEGDRGRGAAAFAKLCLACHYLQGWGQRVGPDLSGLASRPLEALILDVLDPSRQVAPDYVAYEVLLHDGESLTGLFASESETRITIRRAGAPDENIPRSRIQSLRATGKSLMPDGLEAGMSPRDLADLLAFLQAPAGSLIAVDK